MRLLEHVIVGRRCDDLRNYRVFCLKFSFQQLLAMCVASICLHHYQVGLNIISSSLAQRGRRTRVVKESKELASVLFPFIKLGKDPSGLL
jgi:hypothetical protein